MGVLPGHPPWGAEADAALAQVALARGERESAAEAARSAFAALDAAHLEDVFLRIVLPAAGVLLVSGTEEECEMVQYRLTLTAALIAQRITDEGVRVRWFRGPLGRELSRLTGGSNGVSVIDEAKSVPTAADLGEDDTRLLWLLIEGKTNREIASELEVERGRRGEAARRDVRADRGLLARGGRGPRLQGRDGVKVLRARVDRHRCIGAGNCITVAPTAFDWLKGDLGKADVIDPDSVEAELLREAAMSCPTDAIEIEEVEALLPWQLRGKAGPDRRVLKTFMFTDIVKSTNLAEAMGDDAWLELLRWHDETLRSAFAAHSGEEVGTTGDGFFVGFDSPDAAIACAVAIQRRLADHRKQHGFAPQVRIGLHASGAAQVLGRVSAARGSTRRRESQTWPRVGRSSRARPRSDPPRSTRRRSRGPSRSRESPSRWTSSRSTGAEPRDFAVYTCAPISDVNPARVVVRAASSSRVFTLSTSATRSSRSRIFSASSLSS